MERADIIAFVVFLMGFSAILTAYMFLPWPWYHVVALLTGLILAGHAMLDASNQRQTKRENEKQMKPVKAKGER
jgi:F0F1-type ATP synthase assembly protein I